MKTWSNTEAPFDCEYAKATLLALTSREIKFLSVACTDSSGPWAFDIFLKLQLAGSTDNWSPRPTFGPNFFPTSVLLRGVSILFLGLFNTTRSVFD